jgi:hypothetical protein
VLHELRGFARVQAPDLLPRLPGQNGQNGQNGQIVQSTLVSAPEFFPAGL